MAVTLTRNLKLRINDNLTADAKYNLSRLDLLGSSFLVDSTNTLNIRSQTDILIEPEAADIEGSGIGGTVSIGTSSHSLEAINLFSNRLNVSGPLALKDQALLGNKSLLLTYKSDLEGTTDTGSDRTLQVDLEGADRDLVLGGSLTLGGSLSTGPEDLSILLTDTTEVTFPETGTLATLDGEEVLTNKTIDGGDNTLSNVAYSSLLLTNSIRNADIVAAAGIPYSKLTLTGSIQGSDLSPSFEIPYSSFNLTGSIVNSDIATGAAIAYSKLALAGSIVNADVSPTAAITYPKLSLGNSLLVTDLAPSFILPYSRLNLASSVVNADVAPGAAIAYSKLALTGSIVPADLSVPLPYSSLTLGGNVQESDLVPTILNDLLPNQSGQVGKVLSTDGTNPGWITVSGTGSVTSVGLTAPASLFTVTGSPVTTTGTLDLSLATKSSGLIFSGPATGPDAAPTFRALVATDIPTLPYSKVTIADGDLTIAKTSGLQTALDSKVDENTAILPGTGTKITYDAKGLVTSSSSLANTDMPSGIDAANIADGSVSSTEFQYLNGVTSSIQTQLDTKQGTGSYLTAITGDVTATGPGSAAATIQPGVIDNAKVSSSAAIALSKLASLSINQAIVTNGTGILTTSPTTATELGYVSGVTSSIQTQLGTLGGDISGITTDITGLQTDVTTLQTDLGAVQTDLGTAESSILTLQGDVTSAESDILALQTNLGTAQSNITTLQSGLGTAQSDITSLQSGKQNVDSDLTAIAAITGTGIITRTGSGTAAVRTLTAGTNISITDGDGVSGNPTISCTFSVSSFKTNWITADGSSKVVTHSLGTIDVIIQIFDIGTGETIDIDQLIRTDINTVTLTASQAPATSWRVLVLAV